MTRRGVGLVLAVGAVAAAAAWYLLRAPTMTLSLQEVPGSVRVAPPHVSVTVTVPRFPGARTISIRVPGSMDPGLGGEYGRKATAAVLVPRGLAATERWYRSAMGRLGYKEFGSGSSGNVNTGMTTWMWDYVPDRANPDALTVYLNFHPESGGTAVQYYATAVVTPARPSWLGQLQGVRSARVTWWFAGSGAGTVRLTAPGALASLSQALNRLDQVSAGGGFCPAGDDYATIVLQGPGHRTTRVGVTSCDPMVELDGIALQDPGYTVLRAVARAIHKPAPKFLPEPVMP